MDALANVVSITFMLGLVMPAAMFLGTQDLYYVALVGSVLGANAIVMGVKPMVVSLFGGADALVRPVGARDCDALCNGGPSGGRPGFPSGHMTTVSICVAGLWLRDRNPLILWLGVPWIAVMAWARWAKKCHNWVQIVGGIILGVILAVGLNRLF